jgi:hypothetical protein
MSKVSAFLFLMTIVLVLLFDLLLYVKGRAGVFGFFHFWPSCACVLLLLLSKLWSVDFLLERVDLIIYRFPRIVLLFFFQLFFIFLLHVLRILLPNFLTTDSTILLFGLYSSPILLFSFWYSYSKNKLNS